MGETASPGHDPIQEMVAALGDRADELAAQGGGEEVSALWEKAIAGLDDEESQDRVTLAYAWYQGNHGEIEHGVRLAAGLRDSPVAPVRGQVRALVRNRWRAEPTAAERAWRAETGAGLPGWAFLADEEIAAVSEWVSSRGWAESKERFDLRVAPLRTQDVEAALEELGFESPRMRRVTAAHRAVLTLGAEAGYRSLRGPREAAREAEAAIEGGDWVALRACGTIEAAHGRRFLGGVHAVAADLMAGADPEDLAAAIDQVAAWAREAEPWERERAAADLAAIDDEAVEELLRVVR